MRAFIPSSLPLILLSLLSAEKTFAYLSEDAFGEANYGFKCANRIYKKYEIFAAAKKLCDITAGSLVARIERYIDFSLPWIQEMSCPLDHFPDVPFVQIPIFKDGTVYPLELPPEERLVKDSNGASVKILPEKDHLIIGKSCGIVGAFIDHDNEDGQGVRSEACTVLKSSEDISRPLKSQSNFCGYPPTRSPQGSPKVDLGRTFSRSSSQA